VDPLYLLAVEELLALLFLVGELGLLLIHVLMELELF
jgi:hypothetical protein